MAMKKDAQGVNISEQEMMRNPLCGDLQRVYCRRIERSLSRKPSPHTKWYENEKRKYYRSYQEDNPSAPKVNPQQSTQTQAQPQKQRTPTRAVPQVKSSSRTHAGQTQARPNVAAMADIPSEEKGMPDGDTVALSPVSAGNAGNRMVLKLLEMKQSIEDRVIPKREEVNGVKTKFSVLKIVGIVTLLLVLAGLYIYPWTQSYSLKQDISTLQQTKDDLQTEKYALNLQLEERENIVDLREKAEALDMVDGSHIENIFISVSSDESIEIVNENAQEEVQNFIARFLEALKEKFRWFEAYFG